jgi:uncharacterized protein with PhoU and TrkA domain
LKDLNLKASLRLDVLVIKRKYPPQTITIPSADEVIKKGDLLILAGPSDSIDAITRQTQVGSGP